MADYRLYLLNGQGRISRALPLACETDDQAVDEVHTYPHDHGMELWQLDRFVRKFAPNPPPSTPIVRPDDSSEDRHF